LLIYTAALSLQNLSEGLGDINFSDYDDPGSDGAVPNQPLEMTAEPDLPGHSNAYILYSESVMDGSARFYRLDEFTHVVEEWDFQKVVPLVRLIAQSYVYLAFLTFSVRRQKAGGNICTANMGKMEMLICLAIAVITIIRSPAST
jgi:hypothetical protein